MSKHCAGCHMPARDGTLWVVDQDESSHRLLCGACLRRDRDEARREIENLKRIGQQQLDALHAATRTDRITDERVPSWEQIERLRENWSKAQACLAEVEDERDALQRDLAQELGAHRQTIAERDAALGELEAWKRGQQGKQNCFNCGAPCEHAAHVAALEAQCHSHVEAWKRMNERRAELEAALRRAHACATMREDGTCDGCFVSEALLPAPAQPATAMSKSMAKRHAIMRGASPATATKCRHGIVIGRHSNCETDNDDNLDSHKDGGK